MNTRKLSLFISRWCKANGFNLSISYGSDFGYYIGSNKIKYSFIVMDNQEQLFRQVFIDEGLRYECDLFLLSFFHEIGHYMTDDYWTDKQSNRFMERKAKLDGTKEKDNLKYFYMPDEIMATRWAIDYINENPTLIEEFWNGVQKRIFDIYKEIGYDF